jgi:glyoxylase-like metal-dependent hydrolase (beta-lactamase superfamily II)
VLRLPDDWVRIRTDYLDRCGLPLWLHALVDGDELILLDSGIADTPSTCIDGELQSAGLRLDQIGLVVNSHAHPDHMGGNEALRDLCSPRFAAPAAEASWLEDNDRLIHELWEPNPDAYTLTDTERRDLVELLGERVRIDVLLRDGDPLPTRSSNLTVVTTSGHSPGHIAVHDADRGLLFTFDDVQGWGVPIAHTDGYLAPLYHDVERYRSGLRQLAEVDFETLVPSHGDLLDRGQGLARIQSSLGFADAAEDFVADYLQRHHTVTLRGLATELGTALHPYGGLNLQTMSVAKAHLDHLVRQGQATTHWTATSTDPRGAVHLDR